MTARKSPDRELQDFEFDVCLSFAGEDRQYVEEVAEICSARGIRLFYDKYETVNLWGKDLYEHLDYIYRHCARYCVLFVSKQYAEKLWTNHERKSAQARAFKENVEYILPARFDDTEIPGLRDTVGYLDLRYTTTKELAVNIVKKVGMRQRRDYFPPNPGVLFKNQKIRSAKKRERLYWKAHEFYDAFKRMTREERHLVCNIFLDGCHGDLPRSTHVYVDLVRRSTGFSLAKIRKLLSGLRPLGFTSVIKPSEHEENPEHLGSSMMVYLEYHTPTDIESPSTELAMDIIFSALHGGPEVAPDGCPSCAYEQLLQADFSQLSTQMSIRALEEGVHHHA